MSPLATWRIFSLSSLFHPPIPVKIQTAKVKDTMSQPKPSTPTPTSTRRSQRLSPLVRIFYKFHGVALKEALKEFQQAAESKGRLFTDEIEGQEGKYAPVHASNKITAVTISTDSNGSFVDCEFKVENKNERVRIRVKWDSRYPFGELKCCSSPECREQCGAVAGVKIFNAVMCNHKLSCNSYLDLPKEDRETMVTEWIYLLAVEGVTVTGATQ